MVKIKSKTGYFSKVLSVLFVSLFFTLLTTASAEAQEVIIDNGGSGTTYTGSWYVSGGANPYGANSLWARDGATYTWHANLPQSGVYQVYMWWTEYSSRSTSAPVTITYFGGSEVININQRETGSGGKWNLLGTYSFDAASGGTVMIRAVNSSPTSYCADAVRFVYVPGANIAPSANITSISPNPAQQGATVSFTGSGTDLDGAITGYNWRSSISGQLSTQASFNTSGLPAGTHTIYFRVQDDDGDWSQEVSQTLLINLADTGIIIDNGQAGTSYTGTWYESGASNPYGANSLWARDGATYTWHANLAQSGGYQVYMWWTQWPSRSTSAPVTITYAGGSQTININQQINGGKWNLLGTFNFDSSSGGTVMIRAVNSSPTSYCADAVRFVYAPGANIPPVATITSIVPNPAEPGQNITFTGSGIDSDGTVVAYNWRSSISGQLSTQASFSTSGLPEGTHTIYFRVQDNDGDWSPEVTSSLVVDDQLAEVEHIYVCCGYSVENYRDWVVRMLGDIGATRVGDVWTYRNNAQDKDFVIHFADDIEAMKQALKTPGAHVCYNGHSNYGLGAVFASLDELWDQVIEEIRYIDDDRIFNYSSKWVHVSISGMRTGQAYPYWWPVFKDGESGVMPYNFNDPRGIEPAYNYYMTYQVPGDPTYYRIETARNSALDRFPDSDVPAWYSPTGSKPNPNNPDHLKYYIINPTEWYPSVEITGDWRESYVNTGYFKENYHLTEIGQGNDKFKWLFRISVAGDYKVYAWWPAASSRPTNAPYTVNHFSGSTTVLVNQRTNGGRWNELGEFYFGVGENSVVLSDNANLSNVVADAIRVEHVNNPPEVIQADFRASVFSGMAPLEVEFRSQSTGDITGYAWNFGDGTTNDTRDRITHIYTSPGTYTVSLTVTGPLGSNTKTKTGYITVGTSTAVTVAEFSAYSSNGSVPLQVSFRDRSSGNIVSWAWNFGDGQTSTAQNPTHVYNTPGNYIVSLTVRDSGGNTHTETKTNFVRAIIFDASIDNVDYPMRHYGSKTILFRREPEIYEHELQYSRMLYVGCDSGHYFTDTFHRGTMFYSVNTSGGAAISMYLREYLLGRSDPQIWQTLQNFMPVFDYYYFDRTPSQQ